MSCISSVVLPLEPYEKVPSPSESIACPDVPLPAILNLAAVIALSAILAVVIFASATLAVVTFASTMFAVTTASSASLAAVTASAPSLAFVTAPEAS